MTTFANAALLGPEGMAWSDIVVRDGILAKITPAGEAARDGVVEDLGGQIVSPPLCDVQVNGGAGLMLGDCASVADLRRLAEAHLRDGVPHILPTLISDSAPQIERIADLITRARGLGLWQLQGLHLEGPHIARAGAHDPEKLRPFGPEDLARYARIARAVGCLKITLDPDIVAAEDIAALVRAGIVVALGHSDCSAETARRAFPAGAASATHLFNAMGGLDHRAPGLALAALEHGRFGLIADGVHVAPGMLRLAARLSAAGADGPYLVSDAMAVAGTDLDAFDLGQRRIERREGRLTLADGTLAGADLTLVRAVEVMAEAAALPRAEAIAMATTAPRSLIGLPAALREGDPALFQLWPKDAAPRLHLPGGWHEVGPAA